MVTLLKGLALVMIHRLDLADGVGGAPGTYYSVPVAVGYSFNPVTLNGLTASVFTANLPAGQLTMPGATFWAGMTFDNNGGTTGATAAQLDNLGQALFNPPSIGSSADQYFATQAAGSFFAINNPAGALGNLGGNPPANFGWEFTVDVPVRRPACPRAPNLKLSTYNLKLLLPAVIVLVAGCGTVSNQVTPSTVFSNLSLEPGQLRQHGVALLTPATVTGQEEDKQTLALIFAETARVQLPETRVVTLPEALGATNRAGLADDYRRMLEDYRDTGVLERDGLRRVGQAVGVRYLVLLKLASFNQDMRERFSIFGLHLFQTLYANIRLYVQLWDSDQGIIAWEAVEELHYAYDSGAERPVTFRVAVEEAARQLIARLP